MKVLIVDDNSDDRKLLRLNLERHGCESVIEACDGQEGLEMAKAHRPDLIISDALMPKMDGFEFLRLIKIDEELKAIPFVFHSSVYTGLKDEELASRLGAEAFITKPKEPEAFWKGIAVILERVAAGRVKLPPQEPIEGEKEFLREYSGVVAAKLEQKVIELEHALELMKEAEKNIVKAKKEWERTFDAVLDPIIILDSEYRIQRTNRAMAELLGVTPPELIGTICYEKIHGMQEPVSSCPHAKLLEDSTSHMEEIYEKTVDRYFSVNVYPIQDDEGRLTGSVHSMRDITERKSLEKQLRHSQKMEAIGTLTGGIAHDFNNILTAIIGFASILEMKMSKDDPLFQNVTHILVAADRATSLTRSLLAFSRKEPIQTKPVDLNVIITSVETMLRRLIREDFELRVTPTGTPLTVMADSGQIEQVLLNLTTNARDAMPSGGKIDITAGEVMLDDEFRRSHGFGKSGLYALLVFADNGVGMDKDTLQHIFAPFFTTKGVGKGTGLGLSICYGIIKQHDGYINCYSEPGNGSTFRIYLPLIKSDEVQKETVAEGPVVGGTEKILLADDDLAIRTVTTAILADYGYTVVPAEDGDDAVEMFRAWQEEIDLCLFDLIMPKKGGRDAFEEIRKMRPDARVLFMSGYPAGTTTREELLHERADFIAKPVVPRELLKRIRDILDK